jgi:Xaa-Pro aminopeptidase
MISKAEFAARRQKLLSQLPPHSMAILWSSPEVFRNGDTHFSYRQNSDVYYLTGFNEPESVAVFIPDRAEGEFILFNRVKDPSREVWTGYYAGQEGAIKDYGANQSFPITQLDEHILELMHDKQRIYYTTSRRPDWDATVMRWVHLFQQKVRSGVVAPIEFFNIETLLHEMRLIKSPAEIKIMRQAAEVSAQAHKHAMRTCRAGMYEYQVQAELEYEFKNNGMINPAYGSIVGGGKNACILHYVDNNAHVNDGDLLLIDAGCENNFYASDITRTFPVNGKFTAPQRAIYEVVLRAQLAVINLVKPGTPYNVLQETARLELTKGLVDLGILQGNVETLVSEKAYLPFYMHNIGHWLGMDTHDAGSYKINGQWRTLEAGMVLTVEPGLYIAHDNHNVDPKWRGIGVRIEDDVLVTAQGHDVLSRDVPKTVEEIEKLCVRN